MGRPKGGTNTNHSSDEKLFLVLRNLKGETTYSLARETGICASQICKWTKQYLENGEQALVNKRKPGNPLMKYSRRKELTDIEKLEYELMLYKIEVERLKKGYTEEDVLLALEKLSEKNTK
jgi:transposase-like protein